MITRKPVVAGQFYPESKPKLKTALSDITRGNLEKRKVFGAVIPHAGYIYSGAVAGEVYSRMLETEIFVILGPNHTGSGKDFAVYPGGEWITPIGSVKVDTELASYLSENSRVYEKDTRAHDFEHSIEVQLPFLQHLMEDFSILPICIGNSNFEDLAKAGSELAYALQYAKREATIIASSDMTHYEPQNIAKAKDMEAIARMQEMDVKGLADKVKSMNISMCGVAPVIIMLTATGILGARKGELIEYKTSGDVSGDYFSVVGYAGMIFT